MCASVGIFTAHAAAAESRSVDSDTVQIPADLLLSKKVGSFPIFFFKFYMIGAFNTAGQKNPKKKKKKKRLKKQARVSVNLCWHFSGNFPTCPLAALPSSSLLTFFQILLEKKQKKPKNPARMKTARDVFNRHQTSACDRSKFLTADVSPRVTQLSLHKPPIHPCAPLRPTISCFWLIDNRHGNQYYKHNKWDM